MPCFVSNKVPFSLDTIEATLTPPFKHHVVVTHSDTESGISARSEQDIKDPEPKSDVKDPDLEIDIKDPNLEADVRNPDPEAGVKDTEADIYQDHNKGTVWAETNTLLLVAVYKVPFSLDTIETLFKHHLVSFLCSDSFWH